jgi:RNA polymerase sigma factor (sigma-70 family)
MTVETKNRQKAPEVPSIEELYRSYSRKLIHFFAGKGLEREVAEDLSQEVFFRFLRCNKPLENEDHARNLLFRIAQNLLIDHFRKHNGNVRVRALSSEDLAEEDFPCLAAEELGPEDMLVSGETSRDINAAVSRLPLRYAQAIMLKEYEGLSYREIATHMGVSQKAVESLLHRARSQLKEELAEVGRKRGGWWSGLLVSLQGIRDRAVVKPLRHGLSLGLGSAGVGKGLVNMLVVILLLGSVVGTGVAATVSAWRDTPDIIPASEETVSALAEENEAVIYTGDEASSPGVILRDDKNPHALHEAGNMEAGHHNNDDLPAQVVDLLTETAETARGVIASAGGELDLLLADLGRIVGVLTAPIEGVLLYAGVPSLLLDSLMHIVRMEAARDMNALLVETAVSATYILDETAEALSCFPLQETGKSAPLSSLAGNEEKITSKPPAGSDAGGDPGPAPTTAVPTLDGQDLEAEPTASESGQIVEDTVEGVVDLVVDITRTIGGLLSF